VCSRVRGADRGATRSDVFLEPAILSLRKKIFLFTAVVVVVVFPTALYLVSHQVRAATLRDAGRRVAAVALALHNATQERVSGHVREIQEAARVPSLAAALARRDAPAILQIVHRQNLQHFQVFLATAPDGTVIAADGFPTPARLSTSIQPLSSLGVSTPKRGLWMIGGHLYEMVGAPVGASGALLAGMRLGDLQRFVPSLWQVDILLLTDGQTIYSSLPRSVARRLSQRLAGLPEEKVASLTLGPRSFLAWKQEGDIDYGAGRYTTVVLRSLDGANLLAYEIVRSLLGVGVGAVLLVVLFAWLGARRITQPLYRLSETMSEMAKTGELASDFPSVGGDREISLIESTFRGLVASLEESRQARERSYVEAVGAVVTAADARDHETTGHSFRVAYYAVALARALGLKGDALKAIEWGSLLHDVGKMVVPDDILRKVGPLTEDEWHIMRQHPNWGFDMLAEVGFLQQPALEIVYSHHERWDGAGYPRGLTGADIPLAARIFAVVDTYDAITSDRPYRRAHSHQAALSELARVSGKQLDPRIVETFLQLPEVELRRLRELCKRIHPGLSLPSDLLDTLIETLPEVRKAEDGRR
jgi:putative nucleotidyltransferase with HDIG domain